MDSAVPSFLCDTNVHLFGAHEVPVEKLSLSGHGTLNSSHNNPNEGNSFTKSEYRFEMSESWSKEEAFSFNNVFLLIWTRKQFLNFSQLGGFTK